MAYRDDILATSPDYLWPFDGDSIDLVVAEVGTGTTVDYPTIQICEDATSSLRFNAVTDDMNIGPSNVNNSYDRKAVMGVIRLNSFQSPPKNIYREGANGSDQFNLVLWAGNNFMLDVVTSNTSIQAYSDIVLLPNRSYCFLARIEGTGFGNKVELFIDGVLQSTTEPTNGELGTATLAARVGAIFGNSNNTQVGNQSVGLNACEDINHSMFTFWSGANAQLSDQTIRDLFEASALPGTTITSGTESAMQTQLDAIADSVRPNEPLNIRVEGVSGGGTLNLSADNITHNPLASIHVQYEGTGVLNWTNTNGSNGSIGSALNGGTVNFINPASITLSPLEINSEVRIYDAGTTTEVAGIENSGTSFTSSINVNSVDVVIHSLEFQYIRIENVDMTQGNVSIPISQISDPQYRNP